MGKFVKEEVDLVFFVFIFVKIFVSFVNGL